MASMLFLTNASATNGLQMQMTACFCHPLLWTYQHHCQILGILTWIWTLTSSSESSRRGIEVPSEPRELVCVQVPVGYSCVFMWQHRWCHIFRSTLGAI